MFYLACAMILSTLFGGIYFDSEITSMIFHIVNALAVILLTLNHDRMRSEIIRLKTHQDYDDGVTGE